MAGVGAKQRAIELFFIFCDTVKVIASWHEPYTREEAFFSGLFPGHHGVCVEPGNAAVTAAAGR